MLTNFDGQNIIFFGIEICFICMVFQFTIRYLLLIVFVINIYNHESKRGLSTNFNVKSFGASSSSAITMVFSPETKYGAGTYSVICGPTAGQYLPMFIPFTNATP